MTGTWHLPLNLQVKCVHFLSKGAESLFQDKCAVYCVELLTVIYRDMAHMIAIALNHGAGAAHET